MFWLVVTLLLYMDIIEPQETWIYLSTLRKKITKKITKAFTKFGMPLFGMSLEKFLDTDNYDVFEYGRPPMAIDIITKLKGISFFDAINNAMRFKIDDSLSINVIHINQLIQNKMSVGRSKDKSDIEYLKGK